MTTMKNQIINYKENVTDYIEINFEVANVELTRAGFEPTICGLKTLDTIGNC